MSALRDPQYEKYAQERAAQKSPIDAYKSAGYVPHRGNCHRMDRRPEIRARVRELVSEAAEAANIRIERIMVEIDRVGRANIVDFFEVSVNKDGEKRLVLKDLTALPRECTAAIAGIDFDAEGRPKLKLHDRNQANFALLKMLGGLPDDREPTQINILNALSIEDQRTLADALQALPGGTGRAGGAAAPQREEERGQA